MEYPPKSISVKSHNLGNTKLYILENDLHDRPFGLLFHRPGNVQRAIDLSEQENCYKLVSLENPRALGFRAHGKSFRMMLDGTAMRRLHPELNRDFGLRISVQDNSKEVGRARMYNLEYGFMEDVFLEEAYRGNGEGEKLIAQVVYHAVHAGVNNLLCTSRFGKDRLHKWYKKLNFHEDGIEYRLDF